MLIVAFGHKSRVGKDTACSMLKEYFHFKHPDIKVNITGYADALKKVCSEIYNVPNADYFEKHPEERRYQIPRFEKTIVELWIETGNAIREIYDNTWIDLTLSRGRWHDTDVLLIKDLRYPNEIPKDGITVKINNPNAPILDSVSDNALNGYLGWDYVLNNTGSILEFHNLLTTTIGREIEKRLDL